MEKTTLEETKEIIEEIVEEVKPESKKNYSKLIIGLLIAIVFILIGLVFFLIKKSGLYIQNNAISEVQVAEQVSVSPVAPTDTSSWATYTDKEAGFSFKYPPDRVLVNYSETDNVDGLFLSVAAEKLADIPEDLPSFMGRKDALLEKELLENGQAVGVVKIGSLSGSVSSEYSRFEVCSLFFARKLKFYPGEYRVMLILTAPKEQVIVEMPEFFQIDEANCGSQTMWKLDQRENFDELLQKNQGQGIAQEWYNTFNDIVKTIELFEPVSVAPSATPTQVFNDGLTYTNDAYKFKLNYEAPYRVLTSKDDLYGYPNGIALIYAGGQAYDVIVEVWNSKAAYESEYAGRLSELKVIESAGKFITFLNNTSSAENQEIIDSVKMIVE